MRKVNNIYYCESEELETKTATGIVLELEDGTWLQEQTDSVLMPYEEAKFKKKTEQEETDEQEKLKADIGKQLYDNLTPEQRQFILDTEGSIDIGETDTPWTYDWDAEAQAGYIKLSNHAIDSTVPLTDSVKLDKDVDGKVVGVEILDAGESGAHETTRKRMVENPKESWKVGDWEETGECHFSCRNGYEKCSKCRQEETEKLRHAADEANEVLGRIEDREQGKETEKRRCTQCGEYRYPYDLFCETSHRGATSKCPETCWLVCSEHKEQEETGESDEYRRGYEEGYKNAAQDESDLYTLQRQRLKDWEEEWRAEAPEERKLITPDLRKLLDWKMEQVDRRGYERALELAEQIEREEPDGGTAEWKAFKRLRNTLREELTSLRSGGEK